LLPDHLHLQLLVVEEEEPVRLQSLREALRISLKSQVFLLCLQDILCVMVHTTM